MALLLEDRAKKYANDKLKDVYNPITEEPEILRTARAVGYLRGMGIYSDIILATTWLTSIPNALTNDSLSKGELVERVMREFPGRVSELFLQSIRDYPKARNVHLGDFETAGKFLKNPPNHRSEVCLSNEKERTEDKALIVKLAYDLDDAVNLSAFENTDGDIVRRKVMRLKRISIPTARKLKLYNLVNSLSHYVRALKCGGDSGMTHLAALEACKKHGQLVRQTSGVLYITHLGEIVGYLITNGIFDEEIISAAYLHDVPEELEDHGRPVKESLEEIGEDFGGKIGEMVDLLTRRYIEREDRSIYYKRILDSDEDIKIIKVADTLNTCTTLHELPIDIARRKIKECRKIFLPMANEIKADNLAEGIKYYIKRYQKLTGIV